MAKFTEEGTLGLETWSGFVQKAYTTELYWPAVFPIYNKIRRSDPEISIVRGGYQAIARKVEVEVISPEEPSEDDTRAAEFYESELENIDGGFNKWVETCVGNTPFLGWSWWWITPGLRRLDWRPPDDDPWRSQADDGLIGVRRLAWRDQSSFNGWDLDDATGRLNGMWQEDFPNPRVLLPLDGSLHVTFGDPNNPEGLTPLEAVWRLERIKYGLEIVQGIGYEHTAGHAAFAVDHVLTPDDKALVKEAARALLTAQEGNYIVTPMGVTASIVDSTFAAAPSLLEAIRYYGLLKLQLYHMQWVAIASTAGTGAYSAMSDASSMFLTWWNAMIAGFVDQYDQKVGQKLWDWNKDSFTGATARPRYKAKTMSKIVDLQELGAFCQALKNAGIPLGDDDYISIRSQSGFLPETLPEVKPVPVPAPTPPGAPAAAEKQAGDQMTEQPGTTEAPPLPTANEKQAKFENTKAMYELAQELRKYNELYSPDQPRDEAGRWSDTGGGGGSGGAGEGGSGPPDGGDGGGGEMRIDKGKYSVATRSMIEMADLPSQHTNGIKEIQFETDLSRMSDECNSLGYYNAQARTIVLFDSAQMIDEGIPLHEIGHHVHLSKMTPAAADYWTDISQNGKNARIESYAKTNEYEHFAVAYKYYANGGSDRRRLKDMEPEAYRFVDKLFKDKGNLLPKGKYAKRTN